MQSIKVVRMDDVKHSVANFAQFIKQYILVQPHDPISNLTVCIRIMHLYKEVYLQFGESFLQDEINYFYKFFVGMNFQTPWDKEEPIYSSLNDICRFLGEKYPENIDLQRACTETISPTMFTDDLDYFLKIQV
jgi:hypothetical protein